MKLWDYWSGRYERLWVQRVSLEPSRRLVLEHVGGLAPTPERVLDVGCGVGQLCRELAKRFPAARVLGIDPSPGMVARALAEPRPTGLEHRVATIEEIDPEAGFDLIVSTHALPYMPRQPVAVAEMARRLRPGGRLLLLCANTENLYDRLCLAVVELTTTRARYPSVASIQAMMVDAGLRPGRVLAVDRPLYMPCIHLVEGLA
jgi:trans-aconitate methyltransferase